MEYPSRVAVESEMTKTGCALIVAAVLMVPLFFSLAVIVDRNYGSEAPTVVKPEREECSVKILAFTASWCKPCQRVHPFLVAIKASGVEVEIIDVDANPSMAKKYGITSVPTFLVTVCRDGRCNQTRTNDISVVVQLVRAER
jgi:thiol-disulfide isomerase/thioredoxin